MIMQTVTYQDYDGKTVTRDLYFNITKVEAMKLQIQFEGGLEGHMRRLAATDNALEAFNLFEDVVLNAYGEKLADGRFVKKDADGRLLRDTFEHDPACSEFIIQLVQNADQGADFMRGCLPPDLVQAAKEMEEAEREAAAKGETHALEATEPVLDTSDAVEIPVAPSEPTDEELLAMSPKDMTPAQLQRAYVLKSQ